MNEKKTPEQQRKDKPRSLAELGAALRELRESKGMSLDDVANATCIRTGFLKGIEAGDFSSFKALVYARGFVRSYCDRLDVPELWDEYKLQLTLDTFENEGAEADHARAVYPRNASARVSLMPRRSLPTAAPARGFRHSSLRRNCLIAIVVLIAAGSGAIWFNWDRIRGEITRIQQQQALDGMISQAAEQARRDEAQRAEEEAIARERQAQADAEAAAQLAAQPAPEPVNEPEPAPTPVIALTIRATGDCWLRVSENNRALFEGTMHNGDERTFPLNNALYARYGRGQNVQFSTNGIDFVTPGAGVQRYDYNTDGTATRRRAQR